MKTSSSGVSNLILAPPWTFRLQKVTWLTLSVPRGKIQQFPQISFFKILETNSTI